MLSRSPRMIWLWWRIWRTARLWRWTTAACTPRYRAPPSICSGPCCRRCRMRARWISPLGMCRPRAAVEVGGDWYDCFPLPDGATALIIGDVTGHDLSAAVTMGQLRNMVRALVCDLYLRPSRTRPTRQLAAEIRQRRPSPTTAGVARR